MSGTNSARYVGQAWLAFGDSEADPRGCIAMYFSKNLVWTAFEKARRRSTDVAG